MGFLASCRIRVLVWSQSLCWTLTSPSGRRHSSIYSVALAKASSESVVSVILSKVGIDSHASGMRQSSSSVANISTSNRLPPFRSKQSCFSGSLPASKRFR